MTLDNSFYPPLIGIATRNASAAKQGYEIEPFPRWKSYSHPAFNDLFCRPWKSKMGFRFFQAGGINFEWNKGQRKIPDDSRTKRNVQKLYISTPHLKPKGSRWWREVAFTCLSFDANLQMVMARRHEPFKWEICVNSSCTTMYVASSRVLRERYCRIIKRH